MSYAAFLPSDVKGHEIYVSYLHLCHPDVKGLKVAAVSCPDKMENMRPWRKYRWENINKLVRRLQCEICHVILE